MRNLANIITLSRILVIPLLTIFFLQERFYITIILFSAAALSDGLDGYVARHFSQTSVLGAWLDPLADKLIVISMLMLLTTDQNNYNFVIPTIIIICREVIISTTREWMAMLGKQNTIKVSMLGKCKTFAQMLAVFLFLLIKLNHQHESIILGAYSIFYIATFLTLISLVDYIWKARKAVQGF